MKENDDLLRLAFGELSDDAARAVEAKAVGDASSRAELLSLRSLRASLELLPPPPPDNLSAERLRAAILDRELKTRRAAPLAWAWAPLALATFAAIVLFARPAPRAETQIVSMGDVKRADPLDVELPDFSFPSVMDLGSAAEPEGRVVAKEKALPALARTVQRRRTGFSGRRKSGAAEVVPPVLDAQPSPKDLFASVVRQEPQEPETIAAPPSAVVASAPGGAGTGRDTVVIVSSKRDLETGAPAATETEASNVLVGG